MSDKPDPCPGCSTAHVPETFAHRLYREGKMPPGAFVCETKTFNVLVDDYGIHVTCKEHETLLPHVGQFPAPGEPEKAADQTVRAPIGQVVGEEWALHRVTLHLCEGCIQGEGGECHTPGCILWMKSGPDIPLDRDMIEFAKPPERYDPFDDERFK